MPTESLSSGLLIALSDVLERSILLVSEEFSERVSDELSPDGELLPVVLGGSLQHPPGLPQEKLLLTASSDVYEISEHSLSCETSAVSPDPAIFPFRSSVI